MFSCQRRSGLSAQTLATGLDIGVCGITVLVMRYFNIFNHELRNSSNLRERILSILVESQCENLSFTFSRLYSGFGR